MPASYLNDTIHRKSYHRVAQLRATHGYTQKQVAEAINMSRDHLASIESGRCWMSTKSLVNLSRFYGVSTDYLLGLSDVRTRAA
ncbi:cro-like repressor protein [Rhizobium phage RHph_TM39]|uniref:Cro-like repressor protein n=2 Tax=Cuauhnahuacvirus TaxID=3044696 RepID=A0A7S5RDG7_9CAUD|nr:cro-like repressor protein [Rhizobium phage RHph_TM30]YP_010671306.1 cro-like repressor protein [Rhizobium phage RHph_Y65]QIG71627.1 cro-like repressor protein [Rhizobium phage RHph_TM40]QIG71991.1 cro-like repressor protein [Rhizobium phage RHph_TM2_3B]QIG72354.1 cro-like repressor protein [Rhizobium phage RHph_TM3_3_6]QIG77146.1 cro-like repressor protein [Rhizobium phage RHph_TM39]QIG77479.1 cro-like repressor protein [Rhizobium phage RHph_TM21B]QIG77742.1 cro-like repressor protein [R